MCGVAGIYNLSGDPVDSHEIKKMTSLLEHRGPDGEGIWIDKCIGLGHRRLSIIDLSKSADQPMVSANGKYILVFNGEIYNHKELRKEIIHLGIKDWTTDHSDTETIIKSYESWGLDFVQRLRGIFAFALYDTEQAKLILARDRFGIKPLYYTNKGKKWIFASEVKPLLTQVKPEVNPSGIVDYFETRFAHRDETIFKGIHRLPSGTMLILDKRGSQFFTYYSNPKIDSTLNINLNEKKCLNELEKVFSNSIQTEMESDVPVGVYLSGGIDSNLVAYEMKKYSKHPVNSFSMSFEMGYSEGELALESAKKLGFSHTNIECGIDDLINLDKVVKSLEEPMGDAIIIAPYKLSKSVREKGIKVVMTGEGADEVWGGYQYLYANYTFSKLFTKVPRSMKHFINVLISNMPNQILSWGADLPFDVADEAKKRLTQIINCAAKTDIQSLYDLLLSINSSEEVKEILCEDFLNSFKYEHEHFAGEVNGNTLADQILSLQYRKWLPANINLRQDKMSMAHSVEARVPFLDVNHVEWARGISSSDFKLRSKKGKYLLRKLASKNLDPAFKTRVKMPFHVPVDKYLLNPKVRDYCLSLLLDIEKNRGWLIKKTYIEKMKRVISEPTFIEAKKLFCLLILEVWFQNFIDHPQN